MCVRLFLFLPFVSLPKTDWPIVIIDAKPNQLKIEIGRENDEKTLTYNVRDTFNLELQKPFAFSARHMKLFSSTGVRRMCTSASVSTT